MIHHDQIAETVATYLERHPAEADRLAPLTSALNHPDDLVSRKTFTGHVTCSAIVIDSRARVLHIRHNALNAWLRPGGHLEIQDTGLVDAALREITEETGIPASCLTAVADVPIDIDVHPIPANPAKDEPDHQHFDLCYAFTTAVDDITVTLQEEEVHDFDWLPGSRIEPSTLREKIAHLAMGVTPLA
jgi:8-oxo-dGTP pyrophosphatase MutT (NUDIX family)